MPLDPTVGGLRDRMIEESFHKMLRGKLEELGWFVPMPDREDVTYLPEPVDSTEPVLPNLVNAIIESIDPDPEAELGSTLSVDTHLAFVDVYAEDEAVGKQLSGDVRGILMGQMPSIDRTAPVLVVYDYTVVDYTVATPADPPELFAVTIEGVKTDRPHRITNAWERYLFSVAAELVDERD